MARAGPSVPLFVAQCTPDAAGLHIVRRVPHEGYRRMVTAQPMTVDGPALQARATGYDHEPDDVLDSGMAGAGMRRAALPDACRPEAPA